MVQNRQILSKKGLAMKETRHQVIDPVEASDFSVFSFSFFFIRNVSDTGSNEIAPSAGTDKVTGTAEGRNAIIANGGFTDAPKRRRSASSRNRKRDVTDSLKRNNSPKQEGGSVEKGVTSNRSKRSSKAFLVKRSCCSKENSMPMKPDKKLGNVLGPSVQQARKPRSYLELYRRRFSGGPSYNARSPEGSTLSVCGDSQRAELTDEDTCLPSTPRDDRSELSFYRRLIEGSTDPAATTTLSSETVHQHVSEDTNSHPRLGRVKRNGDKSNGLGYRPYTIEEYRTLPIPKLDRSLGPDKVEMQAKREWLTRRRSYGNSVSARNRQRILVQAQKLETKRSAVEKCFLPPLKDQEIDGKTQSDSVSSMVSVNRAASQKNGSENCGKCFQKSIDVCKISSSRKLKKLKGTSTFSSSLNSHRIIEDSYVESLRQRHLYEKEMVDRIISQALLLSEQPRARGIFEIDL
ncbi:uncharacterized protein LOC143177314 [Calliopsis andreniformis]|uniref:uncharacterized protein LOC143177314 n=1 Tax=Calliopsis andreniformis TaxID=337506 RepID=UPI003FCD19AF